MNNENNNQNNEVKTIVQDYTITPEDGIIKDRNLSGPYTSADRVQNQYFYGKAWGKTIITNDSKYIHPILIGIIIISIIVVVVCLIVAHDGYSVFLSPFIYLMFLYTAINSSIQFIMSKKENVVVSALDFDKVGEYSVIITGIVLVISIVVFYLVGWKYLALSTLVYMGISVLWILFNRISYKSK